MPYKCKIVLMFFFKAHAGLTLDPIEVNGLLPSFDRTRIELIVSREENHFKCLTAILNLNSGISWQRTILTIRKPMYITP